MKQLILLIILSTQCSFFTFCQNELSISYIHRTPEIDFVQNSQNPLVEGWPAVGQTITWEGKIKNWGNSNLNNVEYKWYLDNVEVASGTINIPANTEVNVNYNTTWSFSRKELKLVVDENNLVVEEEENNNEVTIFTDAISVGFYVEQSVYNYFRQNQSSLNSASVCWEDWAHRQVGLWNNMFANAIYPSAPMGVLDRIRLDKITVVPDGALPLNGGVPSNNPNSNDKSVDLIWGFPASLISNNFYDNITEAVMTNPFYYEGSLIHELGHARYLVDLYGFNIDGGVPGERIEILENGEYVLDTEYMPFVVWDIPYLTPHTGFMNNANEVTISEFTVLAMNRIAGHRATQGNQNSPGNIGEFLDEIPSQNEVTLKDNLGNIIPNADVKIYQGSPLPGVWYGAKFDNIPDLNFTSNSNGKILLGSNPFSLTGNISHTYGFANGVIILRVENSDGVGYGFLDLPTFNLEYFRGNTTFASYELILENWIPNTTSNCPNELTDFTFLGEFENSKYFLSNDPANWTTAQSNANAQGGYLASINSQTENDFILGNINEIVFIGYNDAQVEGNFEWDSGEPVTFEALVENNVPNKDFAKMNFWNGNWGLDGEFVSRKYIVEIPCSTNPTGLQVNCDLNIDPNDLQVDESDPTGNIVNWTPPTATTDCPGGIVSIEQISGQSSGSFFTAWTISDHIVVYKITDACGNEEVCVTEFEVNGIYGDIICPDDIIVEATSVDGAVVNFGLPTITPSTCIPGVPNQVVGPPSGSVFPIGTTEIQFLSFFGGSNTYCQIGVPCSFTITVTEPNTGGCPGDISGFTTLGEFGDSKYYISNDVSRPVDAQTVAESNGGYLAAISSQAENDFIQQNISDMVYIGLNDYDSEGNLEWFNGEAFTFDNINPCSFCNENSDEMDFVIMAPWNGEWSFSNFYNNRKYIMEIPCSGGDDECSFNVTFETIGNGNNLPLGELTEVDGGYQMSSFDLVSTPNFEIFNYLRDKEDGSEISVTEQQLILNPATDGLAGYWDKENNVFYSAKIQGGNTIDLVKYDEVGNAIWSSNLDMSGFELYNSLRVKSFDDGILITSNSGPNDFLTIAKTNLNGNLIWKKTLNLNADSGTSAYPYNESNDGGYYIQYYNSGPFVAKIDEQGNLEWTANNGTSDPPSEKRAFKGVSGDDSRIYFRRNSFNSFQAFLTVFDADTGDLSWNFAAGQSFAGGSNAYRSFILNTIPANDGGVVVFYQYHLGFAPAPFIYVHERFDADGNLVWSRETPSEVIDFIDGEAIAANDGGFVFGKYFSIGQNPDWTILSMTSDGYFEPDCGGGTGGDLPDLTISNLTNIPNSGMGGEVVFFNFDLNNVGTITASGDYNINMYISTDEIFSGDDILVGEVPTGDTPVGTIANVPGAITVPNLSDGNYFLIIFADALEEIEESDEINNMLTTAFEITSDGGGGCPTSLSGYTALGEFNGSAYFLSEDISRPIDAQALAESHGGYLATISSQAENDFIQQGISEMVYIGLNDYDSEGNLEWFSGEPFTFNNINPCNFCNENSDDQDFVIIAPWNGEWSFSNFWNQRKYVVEIPCSSTLTDPNMNNAFVIQNLDQESLDRLMIKKVFPNPAMDFIYTTISSPMEQEVEVQIFDARGTLMKNVTILLQEGENVNQISISDLPGGFYSAFVLNAQGKNATKRFVKVRD